MQRRNFIKIAGGAMTAFAFAVPAWAGREIDNREGRYNGAWNAQVKIEEPEKEAIVLPKVKVELQERYIRIYLKDETVVARHSNIFTTGYKTEISARHPTKDINYFVTIPGAISND